MCHCEWDAVIPSFYTTKIRKARSGHRCHECGTLIAKGESYRYTSGKWDGSIGTFHTCSACDDTAAFMSNNSDCWCPVFGEMYSAIQEELSEWGKDEGELKVEFQLRLDAMTVRMAQARNLV